MDRRHFMKTTIAGVGALAIPGGAVSQAAKEPGITRVALIKGGDRKEAVSRLISMFDYPSVTGKNVFIKPNFNTADPFPGSTHNDTLSQVIKKMQALECKSVTVGDRSGPQATEEVLEKKGINRMARELGFTVIDFSKLAEPDWVPFKPDGSHWQNGFTLAKPALEAEYLIMTHCLKTHQYGGVFTLSLKNTVGMAPRSLMGELHRSKDMRRMIAELNQPFQPQLIIMDGAEAFVDGGPMTGTRKQADVYLAGTDRIAMDAVALAILKELGANEAIMSRKVFAQEQIERAVQLNLGVDHGEKIELITADAASRAYGKKIREILLTG